MNQLESYIYMQPNLVLVQSHHLATPAGRPPLHHHHQHAAPIRFLPKGEADELMMALEGGASKYGC